MKSTRAANEPPKKPSDSPPSLETKPGQDSESLRATICLSPEWFARLEAKAAEQETWIAAMTAAGIKL